MNPVHNEFLTFEDKDSRFLNMFEVLLANRGKAEELLYPSFLNDNQRRIDFELYRLYQLSRNRPFGLPGQVDRTAANDMRLMDIRDQRLREIILIRAGRNFQYIYARFMTDTQKCPENLLLMREFLVFANIPCEDELKCGDYFTVMTLLIDRDKVNNHLVTADFKLEKAEDGSEGSAYVLSKLFIDEEQEEVVIDSEFNIVRIEEVHFVIPSIITYEMIAEYASEKRNGDLLLAHCHTC